jgi:coenzyme F420-reducing hydrogenase delta subunit
VLGFENGADGVLVAGCLEGGCHFIEGNLVAKRRVNQTRDLLAEIGIEKERLRMVNISAAMGRPLVDIITDMIKTVCELGPNPLKSTSGTKKRKTCSKQARWVCMTTSGVARIEDGTTGNF